MVKSNTKTNHKHINLDQEGEAYINGTRIKVKHLIFYYRSGASTESILEGFPNITPAQFFDALSYYHDHKEEINDSLHRDDPDVIEEELGVRRKTDGTLKFT